MHFVYLLAVWFLSSSLLFAQTLTIQSVSNVCYDQESLLTYSSTVALATENVFTIDVRGYYNDAYVKTFPATVKNGKVAFTIKDLNFPDYVLQSGLQVRLASTKPALKSEWFSYFYLNRRASVTLTAPTIPVINPLEPTGLQFTVDGSGPVNVVLTDSSQFTLSSGYYQSGTFVATQLVNPKTTTTYSIARISNVCGVGVSSGSATVQVNPISVRTASVNANQLCIGSELRVGYSTQDGAFTANNQFKIRLTGYNAYSGQEDPSITYEFDAVLDNGLLKATIPPTVSAQANYTGSYYSVRVRSTAPATLSDHAGYYVAIRPASSAIFTSESRTIAIGQTVDLGLKFQGQQPFSALLSDGTVLRSDYYSDYPVQTSVRPSQTTTYTVKSLQTGCGSAPMPIASSVIMTVNPGIAIDSVSEGAICEGQTLRIKFLHNLSLGANNQFLVRFRHSSGVVSNAIPAQQQGNYLTVKVPLFTLPQNQTFRNRSFTIEVSSTQPAYTSEAKGNLNILTYPTMRWSDNNVYTIDKPQQQVNWFWTGDGGGPYQLEMETGETASTSIWDNVSAVSVPGNTSRTFRVKSVRNACFVTNNPAQGSLTVRNTDGYFIYVKPYKGVACQGDSIELSFETTGEFAPGNQFRIQSRDGSTCCSFPNTWATTTKSGTIKFKLPTDFGWYSTGGSETAFRIASTNPVVFSEDRYLTIHRPVYNVSINALSEELLQPGTVTRTINYLGGTPVTINYTLGGTNYSLVSSGWYSTDLSYPVNGTTNFTVNSISNACGPVPVNQSTTHRILPYSLKTPAITGQTYEPVAYCAGSTLTLPYVMVGQPDPAISLSVEYRRANATEFRTLASSIRTNPVVVTLPDTLQTGDYVIRLVSNLAIASPNQTIRVRRKATALLSTDNGVSTFDLFPGSSAVLRVNFTGSPDWTVLFTNGLRQVFSSSPGTMYINPKSKTVYTIQAVTNSCGYGTASGEVSVRIKPTLSISMNNNIFCAGSKIPVTYNAQGDFEPGNRIKIGLVDGTTVRWLDSTAATQGTFQLSMPGSLTVGNSYSLKLVSTNPVQETQMSFQLLSTPIVTLGGNSVINPQQTANIRLKSNQPFNGYGYPIQYTLSTGESGEFFPWPPSFDLNVRPTQTTTYQLASVSNACGAGQFSGSATVTVNPPSDRQVMTADVSGAGTICSNDTIQVIFDTRGTFSATNRFTVQLSDSTGTQFSDLTTFGTKSPLKALIPATMPRGSFYRVRVVASDAGVSSSTNPVPLVLRFSATAAFESATIGFTPGKPVKLKINLTGEAPWSIRIGNEFNPVSLLYASSTPYTIDLSPTAASSIYKLYQVANGCGFGRLVEPSTVQISVLTATDPALAKQFLVYPNPTNGLVTIRQEGAATPYRTRLTDLQGNVLQQKSTAKEIDEQDLSVLSTGVYLLTIETDKSSVIFRILKH
ncbi:T9SS type A sorting domain-containing protein [Spirosoma fluviale]|uniref:Por secretion system C-terminal sorting domain-containing protein n=1 Tax=Spirosoma fluviale TaxID=1597977 RepID=A0A286FET6_9BACT|nr:T9SS type A sorting domain-containing protein [Spirosoma fluviale]SOD81499.1 Por secretion system C-terminal sorting domain-containing protein [Spirosoma fluviale]